MGRVIGRHGYGKKTAQIACNPFCPNQVQNSIVRLRVGRVQQAGGAPTCPARAGARAHWPQVDSESWRWAVSCQKDTLCPLPHTVRWRGPSSIFPPFFLRRVF